MRPANPSLVLVDLILFLLVLEVLVNQLITVVFLTGCQWWRYRKGSSPDPIYFIAKGGGGGAVASAYSFGTNGSPGGSGGGGAGGGPGPKPGGSNW